MILTEQGLTSHHSVKHDIIQKTVTYCTVITGGLPATRTENYRYTYTDIHANCNIRTPPADKVTLAQQYYNPRQQTHNKTLIAKMPYLNKQDYLIQMLLLTQCSYALAQIGLSFYDVYT